MTLLLLVVVALLHLLVPTVAHTRAATVATAEVGLEGCGHLAGEMTFQRQRIS